MSYTYDYPHPGVTTDCLVFRDINAHLEVLLIQRRKEPFKDRWALPGGFVGEDETLEECAIRELKEETGIEDVHLHQFRVYSKPGRDPRGRTISMAFYGITAHPDTEVRSGDDAYNATWYPVDNLPKLAFDHEQIVNEALEFLFSDRS
jgi:8-oxo-dGTP diphosphatase